MPDRLGEYRARRDFEATPEPGARKDGADDSAGKASGGRFVVHEHHARRLHWDLRLERDGLLVSWALPRGVPDDPKENRLAVHTEDHPLDYIDFEGEIPAGSYGAGTVKIWDRGNYECHKFHDDEVIATFHGERVQGKYALFQTKGNDWMIHRMDPPVDPAREPMPERVVPMLARAGELPAEEAAFGYEIKWDGIRVVLFSDAGRVRLQGRNGADFTPRYPEVRAIGRALGSHRAVLDGEVVAFDDSGRPSFERLQGRMHLGSDAAVRRRAREIPVSYIAFDLLYLDGHSTMKLAYRDRRGLLEDLELEGPSWRTPAYHVGDGRALLEASAEQGLEGIVAKRLDSRYEPGRRGGAWVKVKNTRRQEVVIGGWTPGAGGRGGRIGALVVGYYDATPAEAEARGEPQRLLYAGKVGTGFTEATLAQLEAELGPLRRKGSPFDGRQPPKDTVFVERRLVADVVFTEWTRSGTLRAPSFKGLRADVEPGEVIREPAP